MESCATFETEIQINDGCSLVFKMENNMLTMMDRGVELQQIPDWTHFVFAFNEKTLTLVTYRKNHMLHGGAYTYKKTVQTHAELLIEHNDTNEFKSTSFCQTDKKDMKIHVKPKGNITCRTAKILLVGQVELLTDSVTTKASNKSTQTTPKSSESSQSAGFEWWYGLIIGIVVL
uniref:Uncharacterized protein n=1 Tax=Panagrolaimus davidi TaxID=227884 RepID=A0A914PYM7_9BILA